MATPGVGAEVIKASTEQLLDSAPDGFVIIDHHGLMRLVNRQVEALFGYRREELIGESVEVLVPENARSVHLGHRARYFDAPDTRPMGAGLELLARRKDGSEFPVDISLSSLETEEGLLVSAAIRDVTERKRAEQERVDLQAQLEQSRREEERAALEAQLHQAQRLESIGQLAGGVAHDFNNLLGGIMNYAGVVSATLREEMDRRGLLDDDTFQLLAQDVDEISKVAKRGAELTHQLLIFSRRDTVKPEIIDLNAVVVDMERLLRRTIGENIDLRTSLHPDLPRTKLDRGQVEQVLMNLVVNARDAMPGGGTLEIKTDEFQADETYVNAQTVAPGRYARLVVSDTGSGMTPEVVRRAFEPFFTTKPKGAGSGLGLATSYGIVTQAGGDVAVYSEPGLGTTIRAIFPATEEVPSAPARLTRPQSLRGNGETVLLVEDEEIVREPARRMLVRQGYDVLVAADAEEALRVADEHEGPIDLLLTDVVMPGRSGKELSGEMSRSRPGTKVLFMSGYSEDIIVHRGVLEAGVQLIEKPFSADALLRKVRDVLEQ